MKILFKYLSISIFLIAALIGCNKEKTDLKLSETVPGGCAAENAYSSNKIQVSDTVGVIYSTNNGNLDLFVGFNGSCCVPYSISCEIKNGTIFIKIMSSDMGSCNCICYHTYDFKFIGTGANYKYNVTINNYLTFTGEIKH